MFHCTVVLWHKLCRTSDRYSRRDTHLKSANLICLPLAIRAADRSASQQASPSSFAYTLDAPKSCRRCVAKHVSFTAYSKAETMAATRINPDAFLQTDGGRVWTPERNAEAWRRSFEALDVGFHAELSRLGAYIFGAICPKLCKGRRWSCHGATPTQ
jgi:hypothetical protein